MSNKINVQGWIDVEDIAGAVMFLESKGIKIRNRSHLIRVIIKMLNRSKPSSMEAVEILDNIGFMEDSIKLKIKLKGDEENDEEKSLDDIAKELLK